MRLFILIAGIFFSSALSGQVHLSGKVVDLEGVPIAFSNVILVSSKVTTETNKDGNFTIIGTRNSDTIIVTHTAYITYKQYVRETTVSPLRIVLNPRKQLLDETVISTGYYKLPKERMTGSFTYLDSKLINRTVGPDLLSRLEGVTSGLQFNQGQVIGENKKTPSLRVRGLATIESDETPLIVLDNFPYEGDINNINPNDVESVTVLKDAAAASIWGARAGNGVIVITTKKGRYNQKTNIVFDANSTIGAKPNLFYNNKFLPSSVVLGIEQERFLRKGYSEDPLTVLPDFVESLILSKNNQLNDEEILAQKNRLSGYDIRNEALKYLYQNSLNQQYALNLNGGGDRYRYFISAGYDNIRESVIGNDNKRLSLNVQNSFNISANLELTLGLKYTDQRFNNNGQSLQSLNPGGQLVSTYQRLANEQGESLSIPYRLRTAYVNGTGRSDLLDWNFKPLQEQRLADNTSQSNEFLLNSQLNYRFFNGFNALLSYQHLLTGSDGQNYHAPESFYTRDLVNKFTQSNGDRIIPYNGILESLDPSRRVSQSGRFQLNYSKLFNELHELNVLAGTEVKDQVFNTYPGYTLYNYDNDLFTGTRYFDYTKAYPVLPAGSMSISTPGSSLSRYTDRYLSYFANASYTYAGQYTFSGSTRWDGSNLFGVKTNQKGVPLWSVGGSWELSKAHFYDFSLLPYQRLRLTYGVSGNVNKYVSAYPTIVFGSFQQLPSALLTSIGNPGLRWEQVKTLNIGWDFGLSGNRIKGSIEYYKKKANDLIGVDYMAPSTGVTSTAGSFQNKINYANMNTSGLDLQLTAQIFKSEFGWQSTALFSYVRNKITHFNTNQNVLLSEYFNATAPPMVQKSRDVIYALPWNGLNPANGKPIVLLNGEQSAAYQTYIAGTKLVDLIDAGVTVPPYYGSLRNTFTFKNFELSALITWKAGFVFRRSSISPGGEYQSSLLYHTDYLNRWKAPGDEFNTQVPSSGEYNSYQSQVYNYSTALITKGDHIRLQDLNVAYNLGNSLSNKLNIQNIRVFLNCTNLGILWRANKQGLDPDYPQASYPLMRTVALGIQMTIH